MIKGHTNILSYRAVTYMYLVLESWRKDLLRGLIYGWQDLQNLQINLYLDKFTFIVNLF